MRHYCTIFDSNYLAKGVAMIRSLIQHSSVPTRIHVYAINRNCEIELEALNLPGVAIWSIGHIELFIPELVELRKTRTHQEWCWTAGSVFTEYVFKHAGMSPHELTYIDADCFFFSDPEIVFDEIGDKSIAITPHRFAKKDEARLLPNGKYAVQWVTFRGDVGRRCLSKWAAQVREWCFYRHQDGKFADQKYLDSWMTDYPGEVCEISNIGVGTAPWNLQQYRVTEGPCVDGVPVVMYHFHEYIHGERLTNWPLRPEDKKLIYEPYAAAIADANMRIQGAPVHLQA